MTVFLLLWVWSEYVRLVRHELEVARGEITVTSSPLAMQIEGRQSYLLQYIKNTDRMDRVIKNGTKKKWYRGESERERERLSGSRWSSYNQVHRHLTIIQVEVLGRWLSPPYVPPIRYFSTRFPDFHWRIPDPGTTGVSTCQILDFKLPPFTLPWGHEKRTVRATRLVHGNNIVTLVMSFTRLHPACSTFHLHSSSAICAIQLYIILFHFPQTTSDVRLGVRWVII